MRLASSVKVKRANSIFEGDSEIRNPGRHFPRTLLMTAQAQKFQGLHLHQALNAEIFVDPTKRSAVIRLHGFDSHEGVNAVSRFGDLQ